MSLHFHRLIIKEVRKETAECVSLLFEIPDTPQESFQFTQGQNLVLKTTIDGQELRRNYSICSSPLDHELRVAIKKIKGGVFSSFANEKLQAGHSLEVMPPTGKFYTPLNPAQQKNYLALAAGSGITPLLSIIKTTLATESNSSFTLVYGNRNRHSIIFFEQLEALKNQYMNRFQLIHVLSREKTDSTLNFGRIDLEKLEELSKLIPYQQLDDVFLCGPLEMVMSARSAFLRAGVEQKHVHSELFGAPDDLKKIDPETKIPISLTEQQHVSQVLVMIDGKGTQLNLARGGETVLDAALKTRRDLPYACKGGVCSTCKAKVLEGEVEMDLNYSLSDEEVAEGFILTCQAHPISDRVTIDFDEK